MKYNLTRLAPTPSGFLHLGNVLSFAVTAFLAKNSGARLLLRIDDMDQERVQAEFIEDIFKTLQFLDIPFDKGPVDAEDLKASFSQSHRLNVYNELLRQLKEEQSVFACTCSRAQLTSGHHGGTYPGTCRDKQIPLDTPGVAWRIYTDERILGMRNTTSGIMELPLPGIMRDFVVRKKDGFPAYQLTSLADDLFWGADLIVRGADLIPSTLAQLFLAQVTGKRSFVHASFHHHRLLKGPDGGKLSKSAGSTSVQFMRKKGYPAAAIYSMIGSMAGINHDVTDWYSLGRAVYAADLSE